MADSGLHQPHQTMSAIKTSIQALANFLRKTADFLDQKYRLDEARRRVEILRWERETEDFLQKAEAKRQKALRDQVKIQANLEELATLSHKEMKARLRGIAGQSRMTPDKLCPFLPVPPLTQPKPSEF